MYVGIEPVRDVLRGDSTVSQSGTAADLTDAQIQLEIDNAAAQINSTLRGHYTVPFVEPFPILIVSLNRDIAAYLCDLIYRKSREYESDNYPIIRRYDRARELLEWLRNGTISLGDVDIIGGEATVVHMYENRLMVESHIFDYFSGDR